MTPVVPVTVNVGDRMTVNSEVEAVFHEAVAAYL
jgi:hypothetical protein